MFVVLVGSVWTTVLFFRDLQQRHAPPTSVFGGLVALWLWFTVLFANFAEALAEGRGKAQADTLRKTRSETVAHVRQPDGTTVDRPSSAAAVGDAVRRATRATSSPATVTWSRASPRSTSRPSPASRPRSSASPGGDRSAVTGGTRVLSDGIVVKITTKPGESFIDRMIALVEGARPPEDAERDRPQHPAGRADASSSCWPSPRSSPSPSTPTPTSRSSCWSALLVCLAPTTIGALLSAIGIAGMDRLVQRNVLAMSGRAVEAAGDVSTLLLDKTGTITYGNRMAVGVPPRRRHRRSSPSPRSCCSPAGRRDPGGPLHRRPWPRSATA